MSQKQNATDITNTSQPEMPNEKKKKPEPLGNVVQVLNEKKYQSLATPFLSLILASDDQNCEVQNTLKNSKKSLTVFVPINTAFDGIDAMFTGLTPPEKASAGSKILQFHMVDGIFTIADLIHKSGDKSSVLLLKTHNAGKQLIVQKTMLPDSDVPQLSICTANFVSGYSDIRADNAIIHFIDGILDPDYVQVGKCTTTSKKREKKEEESESSSSEEEVKAKKGKKNTKSSKK